ncbi:hypothetical protein Agabi119p4_6178 [Agaricus bisporus var. burnettii]|nr:hypothetical protein Agabi119p4_6178 [Agaricus bisporus var. burnettii]
MSPSATAALSISNALAGLSMSAQGAPYFNVAHLESARRAPVQGAGSLAELLGCVPAAYRDCVRPILADAMKARRQWHSVSGQLRRLRDDKSAGRTPSQLKQKVPAVQFTKGFLDAQPSLRDGFAAASASFSASALDTLISGKESELEHLASQTTLFTTPDSLDGSEDGRTPVFLSLLQRTDEVFDRHHRDAKVATWGPATADSHGRPVFTGWKTDEFIVQEYQLFCTDIPFIFNRAVALVDDAILAEEVKRKKKQELADVVMKDVDEHITSSSIQSMIDKRVTALVGAQGKGKGKVSEVLSKLHHHETLTPIFLSLSAKSEEEEVEGQATPSGPFRESPGDRFRSIGLKRYFGVQETSSTESSRRSKRRRTTREREGEGESSVEDESEFLVIRDASSAFRWDSPASYPDWLLTVPLRQSSRFILERTPIVVLESMRYRSSIHEIECELPSNIASQLSAGMKYMMPCKFNKNLILDAWDDFVDRLRWNVFWKTRFAADFEDDFDPDFRVEKPRQRCQPLDRCFEFGIAQGHRAILDIVSKLPDDEHSRIGGRNVRALNPSIPELRDYLTSHELVVLVTDKNLGCAVAPRSWIIDRTFALLSNPSDYTEIPLDGALAILKQKSALMLKIANNAEEFAVQSQLPDFFKSQLTDGGAADLIKSIPTFYCIPKIHKTPIAARPILPCHSVIQGPAGKFVSKLLKPVIAQQWSIIHGTKDLAIKLSKILPDLPYTRLVGGVQKRLFLVSGDVVAFYPNVPVEMAHDIALEFLTRWYAENSELAPELCAEWLSLFRDCMTAADDQLLCQFMGRYFKQARGLAMGVASSPDLCNLFGCYFENQCEILTSDIVPFYGRYIDDCLALVYASDEKEAEEVLSANLHFDGCTLKWTSSGNFMVFLDMMLYFENGTLRHKPYRKPMNHFERLPWISAHPEYVKKGTFVGELSRLATLSSVFDDYATACKELANIYIARGYPPMLIAAWLRDNYRARWDARLREFSPLRADVLVLKSEYNISWDWFNVQQLSEQVKSGWMSALRALAYGAKVTDLGLSPAVLSTRPKMSLIPELKRLETSPLRDVHFDWIGTGLHGAFLRLDTLGLLDRRFIVSKKRTKQLYDLTSMWRKTVLERRDRLASEAPDALTNRPVASAPLTQTELRASIVEKVAAAGPSTRRLRPPRREGPLDAWLIRKESNPAERED